MLLYKRQTTVKKQRPVNLALSTIQFPAPAIASILHRITGVIMLVALVFLTWALVTSLQSEQQFNWVSSLMDTFLAKFIAWGILTALGYHLLAGLRHLVMDMGHWEELQSGKLSAKVAMVLAIVLSVLAGVWLW